MTNKELMYLIDSAWPRDGSFYAVFTELIARSDLIAAMARKSGLMNEAEIAAYAAHVAPKKKYTVDDIKRGIDAPDWHYIYCGEYGYSTSGWCRQRPDGSRFKKEVADAIYACLVATNSLPEEYR